MVAQYLFCDISRYRSSRALATKLCPVNDTLNCNNNSSSFLEPLCSSHAVTLIEDCANTYVARKSGHTQNIIVQSVMC